MKKSNIIRVVGIDFGTSTSLIKVKRYQDGEPLGDRFLTTSVTFGNGEADTKAVTIVRKNADGTMTCGRDADEPVEGARIFKNFKVDLECENTEKRELARQLTESFLAYMFTWYTQQSSTLGSVEDEEQTIISYPVKWKNETRTFMEQAARKAGFKNVTSMDEASAALYTVLCQKAGELGKQGILKSGQNGYLLLVDMGAGTTDLAFCRFQVAENPEGILHAEDISNEIIATWPGEGSCLTCGGCEIDKALETYVADYLKGMKSNGQSFSHEQAEQIASANSAAKKWKEETVSRDLNEGKKVITCGYIAPFSMIFEGASFPGFDRFRFEQMISDHFLNFGQLLESGMQMVEMKDEELSRNHLDLVILTGGHSNWYFAKDMLDGTRGGLYHPLLIRAQSEKQRVICLPNPQETVSVGLVYSFLPFKMEAEESAEPELQSESQPEQEPKPQPESQPKSEPELKLDHQRISPPSGSVSVPLASQKEYYNKFSQKILFIGGEDIAVVKPNGTVYCTAQEEFHTGNLKDIDKLIAVSYLELLEMRTYQIFIAIDKRGYPSFDTNIHNDRFKETIVPARKTRTRFVDFLRHGFPQLTYLIGLTYDGRIVELDGSETGRSLTPFNDIVYMTGTWECICFFRTDGTLWEFNGSISETDKHLSGDVKEHEWSYCHLKQFVMSPENEWLYAGLTKDGTIKACSAFSEAESWKKISSISIGDNHLIGLTIKGNVKVCEYNYRPFMWYPLYDYGVTGLYCVWGKFIEAIADGRRSAAIQSNGRVVYTTWGPKMDRHGRIKDYGYLETSEIDCVKLF
ncbi:hypothetical protein [Enterocloster citroniae]|uniref:hypothetical protein n=1 Tax=Enterocloster citroniae TaxID=358743 RepID=UPI00305F5580|nr:hypothetical protein [Enterocloster citroniae]